MTINILAESLISKHHRQSIAKLQALCFPNVSVQEAELDFCHTPAAHVLVFDNHELIGWAGLHLASVVFEEQALQLGGYGICTHPRYRRRGVATKMCERAFVYFNKHHCDVAFISVDRKNTASVSLHENCGFAFLTQKFSWHNALGELDSDDSGMIAPLCSPTLYARIKNSQTTLYVGKGYW
jgi:GNAT superfamily N-acetyltransferase